MALNVDDSNFNQEVLQAEIPVLVDFWAPWCGPCQMLGPVIEEIAKAYSGRVKVCKVNVDDSHQTASQYRVMSIPTMAIFKDGKVVATTVGVLPKGEVERFINQNI